MRSVRKDRRHHRPKPQKSWMNNLLYPIVILLCGGGGIIFPTPPSNVAAASGILADVASRLGDRIFSEDEWEDVDVDSNTLNIMEISEMRVRDIKRRLSRAHGYGADELGRMLDKKELINALSYEEHKLYKEEMEKRKWRKMKHAIIFTCVAVLAVSFWPLLRHAFEVAHVNFVVYTDKRIHEIGRCREFQSYKGYFGIFFLFIIDCLSLWLSVSILLSWVMTSKYFFPMPKLSISPAQLLTPTGGDAGALGKYGFNVGPMLVSWLLRFINGRVELFVGRAMSDAFRWKQKQTRKLVRKEERAKEKEARRAARREEKEETERRRRQEAEEKEKFGAGETAESIIRNGNASMPFDVDGMQGCKNVEQGVSRMQFEDGTSDFTDLD